MRAREALAGVDTGGASNLVCFKSFSVRENTPIGANLSSTVLAADPDKDSTNADWRHLIFSVSSG